MTRLVLSLLLILLTSTNSWSQEGNISVNVIQNGELIPAKDGIINLKSEEFTFEITAEHLTSFLIGITTTKELYTATLADYELQQPWFKSYAMADYPFNPNRELLLSDQAPNYWHFTSPEDHRFDHSPQGTNEHWTAKRTIRTLNDLHNKKTIPINEFKNSVYLYFYSPIYDDQYKLIKIKPLYSVELRFN
ncbi:hypothetical protein [Myroides pelagicus]|uniref:Uncharacterized protein n=1 Tax=Myroides pelagicus TaxID=270914 RepID=A0A7K1GQ56_9FLAO|nr:hypothetical protein [Myroides pelagicus]MEC4114996.1 hypothetical protein [Myroides pelagicus]MTH30679.1 hypothetical protein [Myroides pelagicus]